MEINFEYPLQWPPQQKRNNNPKRSRFGDVSIHQASEELFNELRLLGAKNLVISTNLQQKVRGGGFYSNQKVDDNGIAIYCQMNGANKVMACDKWDSIEHNIWALALSIGAIRGLERWGGSEFLDGLFTGFAALPAGGTINTVNYFMGINSVEELKAKYHKLAFEFHPDRPNGSHEKFVEMNKQYKDLLSNFK